MERSKRKWRRKQKNDPQQSAESVSTREEDTSGPIEPDSIFGTLKHNLTFIKEAFQGCSDVIIREIQVGHQQDAFLVFIEGVVDGKSVQDHVLLPLLSQLTGQESTTPDIKTIENEVMPVSQLSKTRRCTEAVEAILQGDVALFVDGQKQAVILKTGSLKRRSITEPASETVVRGPREGFTESVNTNLGMVRLKIRSTQLKTISYSFGEHTKTQVTLMYMDEIANPDVIDEVKRRLESIEIDSVLESGYIEELIEDQPYSPFPQMQYTERPDTVAAQLLEGRFAIFIDGTPFVLIAPVTFWQMVQASEDYYERYIVSTMLRWLRFIFLFFALTLPALYVAVTTFHQDMLPTSLLLSVAAARETIPFPALVEALIMEIAFEALREAGIRLPRAIGQAVSILGALVIGQAAVQAGIVSAPMVIIVSLTGIASFTTPKFNEAIAIRILRFPLMFLAGSFGMFGIILGFMWIATHLCSLRSFGVPYLSGVSPLKRKELKDIFIRAPWWAMDFRPSSYTDRKRRRMGRNMKPSPPQPER